MDIAVDDGGLGECAWRISGWVCAAGDLLGWRGVAVVAAEGRAIRRCSGKNMGWAQGSSVDLDWSSERGCDVGKSLWISFA